MLEFDNVFFSYDNSKNVLTNISFKIDKGEFVGIIGQTGSGKSTLIQLMNGLYLPNSGRVIYRKNDENGQFDKEIVIDNQSKGKHDLMRLKFEVGLVFQYPEHQLFEETVLEDVMFGPLNKGLSSDEARNKAMEALSLVNIEADKYKKSPFELSGGEKKKVSIAGILAMDPEIIVLDEPTAALDPESRKEIMSLLKKMVTEKSKTVVMVSHNMDEVSEVCDKVMLMSEGKIVKFDNVRDVYSSDRLNELGIIPPQINIIMKELRKKGLPVDENIFKMKEAIKCLEKLL